MHHEDHKSGFRRKRSGAGFKRGFPPLLLILCLSTFGIAAAARLIDQGKQNNEIEQTLRGLIWLCGVLASIAVGIACCGDNDRVDMGNRTYPGPC